MNSSNLDKLFSAAIELRNAGDYDSAIKVLKRIIKINRQLINAHFILGCIYYNLGQFQRAAIVFRSATILKPNSAMLSLGLFHALINMHQIQAAINEGQRFLAHNKDKRYRELLEEIIVAYLAHK
jgi:tetratricopeptide (TPR) repeat protein